MDWTAYFLATAGAAATLVGLLFVGVQFHLDTLLADLRWQAVARSTFFMYVFLFLMPLVIVIPTLDNKGRSIGLLVMAVFGILRSTRTWWPVWRNHHQAQRERLWQSAWLLVGPLLVYLSIGWAALQLYHATQTDGIYTGLALTLIGFFAIVLRNSWSLLFEISAEQRRDG